MALTISKSVSQSINAATTFTELSKTALSINEASDKLSKVIERLDNALRSLNLGVAAWVEINSTSDDDLCWETHYIGYDKIAGKWCIGLKEASGNFNWPERDEGNVWVFSDGPREMRIRAVEHVPKLIETLNSLGNKMAEELIAKTNEAELLAKAIETSAIVPKLVKSVSTVPQGGK